MIGERKKEPALFSSVALTIRSLRVQENAQDSAPFWNSAHRDTDSVFSGRVELPLDVDVFLKL